MEELKPKPFLHRPVIRSLLLFVLSWLAMILIPYGRLTPPWNHILVTLLAVSIVHLLDTLILRGEMVKYVEELLKGQSERYVQETQVGLRQNFTLLNHADEAGLVAVYPTRAAAMDEAKFAISNAEHRVWMLGIAFTLKLEINDEMLEDFCKKMKKGDFDLRIMLLDALRSPAVFRTFLESTDQNVREILDVDPTGPGAANQYFDQQLFRDHKRTFGTVNSRTHCEIWSCIRYYAHAPTIWMLIVDDEVFLEPYTFGRPPDQHEQRLGGGLPVFRFRNLPGKGTYDILVDHYEKLWLTSDIDLFQMEARQADHAWVLKRILNRGRGWFENAYGVLYYARGGKKPMQDRRKYPRFVVQEQFLVTVRWGEWPNQPGAESGFAVLRSISRCGARLDFVGPEVPHVGHSVALVDCQQGSGEVTHMVRRLWTSSAGGALKVLWVDGRSVRLKSMPQ